MKRIISLFVLALALTAATAFAATTTPFSGDTQQPAAITNVGCGSGQMGWGNMGYGRGGSGMYGRHMYGSGHGYGMGWGGQGRGYGMSGQGRGYGHGYGPMHGANY